MQISFHFVFTSQTAGLIFHVSKSENLFLAPETSSNIISGLLMNPSPLVRVTESHSSHMVNRVIHIRAGLSVCCLFQSSSQARQHVTHAHNSYHSKSSVIFQTLDLWISWRRTAPCWSCCVIAYSA